MRNSRFTSSVWEPKKAQIQNTNQLSVIITASTVGYRMKLHGPKSLYLVDGKPLIQRQVEAVRSVYPNADIVLVVGFYADRVIRNITSQVRIIENNNFETTTESEDVRLGLNNILTHDALIINGDVFFHPKIIENIPKKTHIILDDGKSDNMTEDDVGATVIDGKVSIMSHGLPKKWLYLTYLTDKEVKLCKSLLKNKDKSNKYFFEILNMIIENGGYIESKIVEGLVASRAVSSEEVKELRNKYI